MNSVLAGIASVLIAGSGGGETGVQLVAQLPGVVGVVRPPLALDGDTGGHHAGERRQAHDLPDLHLPTVRPCRGRPRSPTTRRWTTPRPVMCGCSAATRSPTRRSARSPTRPSTTS